jgi:hypothetical protein
MFTAYINDAGGCDQGLTVHSRAAVFAPVFPIRHGVVIGIRYAGTIVMSAPPTALTDEHASDPRRDRLRR